MDSPTVCTKGPPLPYVDMQTGSPTPFRLVLTCKRMETALLCHVLICIVVEAPPSA